MAAVLAPLQQWLLFLGVSLAVGSVAWRVWVAPRAATGASTGSAALADICGRVARLAL
jgi:hypothetical protein